MNKLIEQNPKVAFITIKESNYNPDCIEFYTVQEIDTTGYIIVTKSYPAKVKLGKKHCIFYSVKPV